MEEIENTIIFTNDLNPLKFDISYEEKTNLSSFGYHVTNEYILENLDIEDITNIIPVNTNNDSEIDKEIKNIGEDCNINCNDKEYPINEEINN